MSKKRGKKQPRPAEEHGRNVAAEFFFEMGIPAEEIPALVAECGPGSTSEKWGAVANEWLFKHGGCLLPGFEHPRPEAESELYGNSEDLLAFCLEQRRFHGAIDEDDTLAPMFLGSLSIAVRLAIRSVRGMGEVPPELPIKIDTIEIGLRSLDRIIGWCRGQAGKKRPATKRRRQPGVQPLTAKQLDTVRMVSECNGNFSKAAKQLGCDPKTVRQHHNAAMKKLGRQASELSKPRTIPLPRDRRGQEHTANEDDCRND